MYKQLRITISKLVKILDCLQIAIVGWVVSAQPLPELLLSQHATTPVVTVSSSSSSSTPLKSVVSSTHVIKLLHGPSRVCAPMTPAPRAHSKTTHDLNTKLSDQVIADLVLNSEMPNSDAVGRQSRVLEPNHGLRQHSGNARTQRLPFLACPRGMSGRCKSDKQGAQAPQKEFDQTSNDSKPILWPLVPPHLMRDCLYIRHVLVNDESELQREKTHLGDGIFSQLPNLLVRFECRG
jgi:hypothetical protein